MTTTGRALRTAILRNTRGALGRQGLTTATAGATDRIRDATRYDMDTRATSDEAESYVRLGVAFSGTATAVAATTLTDAGASFGTSGLVGAIVRMGSSYGTITSHTGTVLTLSAGWTGGTPALAAYVVDYAHVAKVKYIDPANGDIYFDPVATDSVPASVPYELWKVWPDDADAARDKALTTRTAPWRVKPLSVLKEVADWTVANAVNAAAVATTLDFPLELVDRSLVVTNSGAAGYAPSESFYVQPNQTIRITGWVATRAQTASVRLRRITSTAADITLTGTSTFTLRGGQWFDVQATIPAGCEEVQLWLGGASASCISEWAGVAMWVQGQNVFSMESRILSKHDVGNFYEYRLPVNSSGSQPLIQRSRVTGVRREAAGDGVVAIFDSAPWWPVFYEERHRYAALQTDYMTKFDRTIGDQTSTDCNEDYLCWATIVELLEPLAATLPAAQQGVLRDAYKNLKAWDRRVGADPLVIPESTTQGSIPVYSL